MITAVEREVGFRKDLNKLLLKHGATLDMDYDLNIVITMCAVSGDIPSDIQKEYTEFKIG